MGLFFGSSNKTGPIDYEDLRKDLEDDSLAMVFGAGIEAGFLEAMDASDADEEELEEMARRRGFNLDHYRK